MCAPARCAQTRPHPRRTPAGRYFPGSAFCARIHFWAPAAHVCVGTRSARLRANIITWSSSSSMNQGACCMLQNAFAHGHAACVDIRIHATHPATSVLHASALQAVLAAQSVAQSVPYACCLSIEQQAPSRSLSSCQGKQVAHSAHRGFPACPGHPCTASQGGLHSLSQTAHCWQSGFCRAVLLGKALARTTNSSAKGLRNQVTALSRNGRSLAYRTSPVRTNLPAQAERGQLGASLYHGTIGLRCSCALAVLSRSFYRAMCALDVQVVHVHSVAELISESDVVEREPLLQCLPGAALVNQRSSPTLSQHTDIH